MTEAFTLDALAQLIAARASAILGSILYPQPA